MIADLKPYPEYKESGLPWVGRMPEHWDVRRLKHLARFQSGDGITPLTLSRRGPSRCMAGMAYAVIQNDIRTMGITP
jgi:hypothetical protein